jgi:hypothetical protein
MPDPIVSPPFAAVPPIAVEQDVPAETIPDAVAETLTQPPVFPLSSEGE